MANANISVLPNDAASSNSTTATPHSAKGDSDTSQITFAMSQPIIFVGGVHGAGKTTITRLLADTLGVAHVTAGTLIQEQHGGSETETIEVISKAVTNIQHNQKLLLQALEARWRQDATTPILLDGHFSLFDPDGDVVVIPIEVFTAIRPTAILLVEAKHRTVHHRLLKRDTTAPSLATIVRLAWREREHATNVSASLATPMWILSGDEVPERVVATATRHLRPLLSPTLEDACST